MATAGKVVITHSKTSGLVSVSIIGDGVNGLKNNSNQTFTTSSDFISGTLRIYYNGQRLDGSNFTETALNEFQLAFIKPYSEDILIADYTLN